jgi:hypothetical protein
MESVGVEFVLFVIRTETRTEEIEEAGVDDIRRLI